MNIDNNIVLVACLKKGECRTYTVLYGTFQISLYTFSMRFVRLLKITEDFLQDVFSIVWNAGNNVFTILKKKQGKMQTINEIRYLIDDELLQSYRRTKANIISKCVSNYLKPKTNKRL